MDYKISLLIKKKSSRLKQICQTYEPMLYKREDSFSHAKFLEYFS